MLPRRSYSEMTISAITESNLRPATVKDVAGLAGVSVATVSRVVNGADNVTTETRTRVLTAVSQLQYRPNLYAAELGRANRNISKRRGAHEPALAQPKSKPEF
jgi:transcriptional regulator with XRE-family HTH domain